MRSNRGSKRASSPPFSVSARGLFWLFVGVVVLASLPLFIETTAALAFPPKDFHFGAAASAYQIEGATTADGRGLTIWDEFVAQPGRIKDGSKAEPLADHFHRYTEDAQHLSALGLTHYSLTISWARVIPEGGVEAPINQKGLDFYKNLIRTLRANGLGVYATLYHWELPSALQKQGGWLNRTAVVPAFERYARTIFTALADQGVSAWFSMNEPRSICSGGYMWGESPPGRCSNRTACAEGDSTTEPYVCGHNALLAHVAAIGVWRNEFAAKHPEVKVGIVIDGEWVEPLTNKTRDIDAARRERVFQVGWWANPIYLGDYPAEMKASLGSRLPTFTEEEIVALKGSADLFALDYYTAVYGYDVLKGGPCNTTNPWWPNCAGLSLTKNNVLIGPRTGHDAFFTYPQGLRKMLKWLADTYNPPYLVVTENGHAAVDESSWTGAQALQDQSRIDHFASHLDALKQAVVEDNVDVRGFFAWSFIDNLEWLYGTSVRFGLIRCDFENNSTRTWKDSAYWYCNKSKELTGYKGSCTPPTIVWDAVPGAASSIGTTATATRSAAAGAATTTTFAAASPVATTSKPSLAGRASGWDRLMVFLLVVLTFAL